MELDWQTIKDGDDIIVKAKYDIWNTPFGPAYAVAKCHVLKAKGKDRDPLFSVDFSTFVLDPFLRDLKCWFTIDGGSFLTDYKPSLEESLIQAKRACERHADELMTKGPFDRTIRFVSNHLYGQESSLEKIARWHVERSDARVAKVNSIDTENHEIDVDVIGSNGDSCQWFVKVEYDKDTKGLSVSHKVLAPHR